MNLAQENQGLRAIISCMLLGKGPVELHMDGIDTQIEIEVVAENHLKIQVTPLKETVN